MCYKCRPILLHCAVIQKQTTKQIKQHVFRATRQHHVTIRACLSPAADTDADDYADADAARPDSYFHRSACSPPDSECCVSRCLILNVQTAGSDYGLRRGNKNDKKTKDKKATKRFSKTSQDRLR